MRPWVRISVCLTVVLSAVVVTPRRGYSWGEYNCRERYPTFWDIYHWIPDASGVWISPHPHPEYTRGCIETHNRVGGGGGGGPTPE